MVWKITKVLQQAKMLSHLPVSSIGNTLCGVVMKRRQYHYSNHLPASHFIMPLSALSVPLMQSMKRGLFQKDRPCDSRNTLMTLMFWTYVHKNLYYFAIRCTCRHIVSTVTRPVAWPVFHCVVLKNIRKSDSTYMYINFEYLTHFTFERCGQSSRYYYFRYCM